MNVVIGVADCRVSNDVSSVLITYALDSSGTATIAQDEAGCIVFGMPKEAIRQGGVDRVGPVQAVAHAICTALSAADVNV